MPFMMTYFFPGENDFLFVFRDVLIEGEVNGHRTLSSL
jgi:hypothetical protein